MFHSLSKEVPGHQHSVAEEGWGEQEIGEGRPLKPVQGFCAEQRKWRLGVCWGQQLFRGDSMPSWVLGGLQGMGSTLGLE